MNPYLTVGLVRIVLQKACGPLEESRKKGMVIFMRKLVFCITVLLFIISAVGCRKEEIIITTEEITVNTLLAKANGELQVATVEEFEKPYYNLTELEEFVANEIDVYNQKAGGEKISFEDIKLKDGRAIILLSYTGMDQYTAFNQVTAAYFNGGIEGNPLNIPATLLKAKDGSPENSQGVLSNQKYKVLVMNEPYDIIVDGTIMYYSDNAVLVNKNTLQSAADAMTVIVYKP